MLSNHIGVVCSMVVTVIAAIVGLGYFFYPPRFPWVKGASKYLLGIFCFWTALIFAKPEVQESIYRPAGFFLILFAGLLLLADFLTAVFRCVYGKVSGFFRKVPTLPTYLNEIGAALEKLAAQKVGALIVLERKQSLKVCVQGGIPFDAEINSETLVPLFSPTSPVHDGAFIVRHGRIQSVKGILPLTALANLSSSFGTRHRAAIGITEKTDAVALAVSEERGEISVACHGCLVKVKSRDEFVRILHWVLNKKNILKLKNVDFIVTAKILDDFA